MPAIVDSSSGTGEVGDAARRGVDRRAAQGLGADIFAGDGLDHWGPVMNMLAVLSTMKTKSVRAGE